MKKTTKRRITVYIALYFLVGLLLYCFQTSLIYYPVKKVEHSFFDLVLRDGDVEISILHVNRDKEKAIIYFGGNGESVVARAYELFLQFPEHTIYLMEYRGYGASTGSPSEKSFYKDALALHDAVSANHQNLSVIGRSLGTGVTTYLAYHRQVDKMVLITPYDSIQSIAQRRFPIYPMSILLTEKYPSVDRVPALEIPTLILLADNDEVIPMSHSQKLIAAFAKVKSQVAVIKNSGHNDLSERQEFQKTLKAFLSPSLKPES
ncbi:alpha/beta hydrolase [Lentisphaera marina]|uniref:alpha/beta hydrolase n=1 Tax=Lentisphaera marina TaxID=1111041 RepID=UPI002366BF62|nr:alpha/beta hydrolase [Lentisphaera marina]MDD7985502.1 alpha/beta hydrolase [Lentisphaera marina]